MIGSKNGNSPVLISRPRPERAISDDEGPRTKERKHQAGATVAIPSSCPVKMKMVGLSAIFVSAAKRFSDLNSSWLSFAYKYTDVKRLPVRYDSRYQTAYTGPRSCRKENICHELMLSYPSVEGENVTVARRHNSSRNSK